MSLKPDRRKFPADSADFISPIVEIAIGKMNVSLSACADYADHRLFSVTNLRNPRFLFTNQKTRETFFDESTDKICGISGNLTQV